MSKDNKRRDSKGRILRTGEQQRSNGQYLYTYKGKDGKNKFVYSWKLEATDSTPQGKRDGLSLRERRSKSGGTLRTPLFPVAER